MQRFILHWGKMGSAWGINRSVAQIHALLYLVGKPLDAEEIATTLSLARSNVSNSLRELQSWGLVRTTSVLGERREHYETLGDVWELFRLVVEGRHKREVEPTLRLVSEVAEQAGRDGDDPDVRARMEAMRDFLQTSDAWYRQLRRLPTPAVVRFMKMGGTLARLASGRGKAGVKESGDEQ
jgi:DNA-binding transcriptional regulator GbsR (MarR family)